MAIPEFLKRENARSLTEEEKKYRELEEKYFERFGDTFATEPFSWYSDQDWIKMMEYCLKKNVRMEMLTGEAET